MVSSVSFTTVSKPLATTPLVLQMAPLRKCAPSTAKLGITNAPSTTVVPILLAESTAEPIPD